MVKPTKPGKGGKVINKYQKNSADAKRRAADLGVKGVGIIVENQEAFEKWKVYTGFRKVLGYSMLSVVTAIITSVVLASGHKESIWLNITIAWLVISIITFIVGVLYTTFWSCPRCGENFTSRSHGPFSSNMPVYDDCAKCGFKPGLGGNTSPNNEN